MKFPKYGISLRKKTLKKAEIFKNHYDLSLNYLKT